MSKRKSETVSQKRGRPPIMDDQQRSIVKMASEAHTERGRQNVHYRLFAISAIPDDPEFHWLCNKTAMTAGAPNAWRPMILSELGRIGDKALLVEAARQLCKLKPRAHDAVAMIRQWRTGKSKPGDDLDLSNRIIGTINNYLKAHPSTSWEQVQSAMATAKEKIDEAANN